MELQCLCEWKKTGNTFHDSGNRLDLNVTNNLTPMAGKIRYRWLNTYLILGYFDITADFANIVKDDALSLMDRRKRGERPQFSPDVLINPRKYARSIAIDKIIADTKVSRDGVEYYKKKIEANESIEPIVVVKHPRLDVYAVLDGHHRYWACKELGKETVDCAVAEDYSSVIFYLTEHGYLQPSTETTKHLRLPAKKMHENLKQFLEDFLDEEKIKQELKKRKADLAARNKRLIAKYNHLKQE